MLMTQFSPEVKNCASAIFTHCESRSWQIGRMAKNSKLLKEFSERLEALLIEKGWNRLTDRELAARLGLGKGNTTMWNWRNGIKMPSFQSAIGLAIRLDVCVDWLLTGRGPKRPDTIEGTADTLDISMLPRGQQVHLRALVHEIQEQIATYEHPDDPDSPTDCDDGEHCEPKAVAR